MSIYLVMPFNYLILCHPLLLLPSIFPSIRVFSNESLLRIRQSGGQSIGASASVLPIFRTDFPSDGLVGSPCSPRDSQESSVQFSHSVILTLCYLMNCSTPGLPVHHQLPKFKLMAIELVMPSSHLILCHPLLLLPSIPPSIRVFSNESTLHRRWPKFWSFSFSISPSNEHPGLISFRMDWLDLPAVQGTLKSLLQHHTSKPSILQCSAFFTVQLSHLYMTTGKTIALTRQTFVGKVM